LKRSKVSQEIAKESAQEGESQEKKAKKAKRSQTNDGEPSKQDCSTSDERIIWSKKTNDWSTHARTPRRGGNQFGTS